MQPSTAKKSLVEAEKTLSAATTVEEYRELQKTLATLASNMAHYDAPYTFNFSPSDVLDTKVEAALAEAELRPASTVRPANISHPLWSSADLDYTQVTPSDDDAIELAFAEVIEKLWRVVRAND